MPREFPPYTKSLDAEEPAPVSEPEPESGLRVSAQAEDTWEQEGVVTRSPQTARGLRAALRGNAQETFQDPVFLDTPEGKRAVARREAAEKVRRGQGDISEEVSVIEGVGEELRSEPDETPPDSQVRRLPASRMKHRAPKKPEGPVRLLKRDVNPKAPPAVQVEDKRLQAQIERSAFLDRVKATLAESGAMRPRAVAIASGIPYREMSALLEALEEEGVVEPDATGAYRLVPEAETPPYHTQQMAEARPFSHRQTPASRKGGMEMGDVPNDAAREADERLMKLEPRQGVLGSPPDIDVLPDKKQPKKELKAERRLREAIEEAAQAGVPIDVMHPTPKPKKKTEAVIGRTDVSPRSLRRQGLEVPTPPRRHEELEPEELKFDPPPREVVEAARKRAHDWFGPYDVDVSDLQEPPVRGLLEVPKVSRDTAPHSSDTAAPDAASPDSGVRVKQSAEELEVFAAEVAKARAKLPELQRRLRASPRGPGYEEEYAQLEQQVQKAQTLIEGEALRQQLLEEQRAEDEARAVAERVRRQANQKAQEVVAAQKAHETTQTQLREARTRLETLEEDATPENAMETARITVALRQDIQALEAQSVEQQAAVQRLDLEAKPFQDAQQKADEAHAETARQVKATGDRLYQLDTLLAAGTAMAALTFERSGDSEQIKRAQEIDRARVAAREAVQKVKDNAARTKEKKKELAWTVAGHTGTGLLAFGSGALWLVGQAFRILSETILHPVRTAKWVWGKLTHMMGSFLGKPPEQPAAPAKAAQGAHKKGGV